jgi:hypothetical protein
MIATLNVYRRPVSGCWVAVRRIHIGRIGPYTAELVSFRPCLKAAWLVGRKGNKLAAAFYPERKVAVGRWVTTMGINIKKMNIDRIKENTAAVMAGFRPCLKRPLLARGSAPFYAVRWAAVGCWVTTRGMSIKNMKIGRIKEKTAVKVSFRPSLKAAGLTVGRGKKGDMAIAWKAGVVPSGCTGRIGLCIRGSTGRIRRKTAVSQG